MVSACSASPHCYWKKRFLLGLHRRHCPSKEPSIYWTHFIIRLALRYTCSPPGIVLISNSTTIIIVLLCIANRPTILSHRLSNHPIPVTSLRVPLSFFRKAFQVERSTFSFLPPSQQATHSNHPHQMSTFKRHVLTFHTYPALGYREVPPN